MGEVQNNTPISLQYFCERTGESRQKILAVFDELFGGYDNYKAACASGELAASLDQIWDLLSDDPRSNS